MSDARAFRYYRVLTGLLSLLFFCGFLFSENKKGKKEEPARSQTTFRVPVNVVVVNATVTDKDGNPVTDLTADDFRVYDEGKLQTIQTFALESYRPPESEEEELVHKASPKKAALRRKASGPRMISIFIDDLTMTSGEEFHRMIESVKEYVKRDMGPLDQLAVLSASGRVQLPFSDDKSQLLQGLSAALQKLNFSAASRSTCPKITDLDACRISDGMRELQAHNFGDLLNQTINCMNLNPNDPNSRKTAEGFLRMSASAQNQVVEYYTRSLIYTFRQHIRALRHFEGPKTIVFFSDGFLSESGSTTAYQVQELIDLALRSGIVLNSVNIQGLPAEEDVQDRDNRLAQESPLFQMAYETGGMFFHNDNNLYRGVRNILNRQSYYYILTYAMPTQKADGSYRRIKVEVTRPGLNVSYRKGYYTQKEELKFESSKKEDIIEALNAPGNMNQIPMTLAYNYFREDDSTYAVSFVTNANIRNLQFIEEEDRRKNLISFIVVVFDENDRYINGLERSIDFRLLEDSYAGLRDRGLTSRVEFKLPIGRYKVKAIVRESTQGKMGSITKAVEIP